MNETLLLIEDDALMRSLLKSLLDRWAFNVVDAEDANQALAASEEIDFDAVIADVNLGPGPTGFDVVEALRNRRPELAVVFLTDLPDPRFAGSTSKDLPRGTAYLRKSAVSDTEMLYGALETVLEGRKRGLPRHDLDPTRPMAQLTNSQLQVLQLVASGLTNAQIAEQRGLTIKAVEDAVRRVCQALGIDANADLNSRVTAARKYLEVTNAEVGKN